MKSIFEFDDYKNYINESLKSMPAGGHGTRGKLAEAANCQRAFVSRVLTGEMQFNFEQAYGLSEFFTHTEDEREFFFILIHKARAGTTKLSAHYEAKIKKFRQERLDAKKRLKRKSSIDLTKQSRYYSAWHYTAIHIITTIKKYRTRESIAKRLRLDPELVANVLEFLSQCGILDQEGDEYKPGSAQVHLSKTSPNFAKNHQNWRIKAIQSVDQVIESDFHYSSVMSISQEDALKIKDLLISSLEKVHKVMRPSKEEELVSLNIDLFRV